MNRILSLLVLLAFTTVAQAQSPYLPYNPDENADGLIGVADLQALLAVYSQEFSSAILSDNGNIAVVEVGSLNYYKCTLYLRLSAGCLVHSRHENSVGLVIDEIGGTAFFDTRHVSVSGECTGTSTQLGLDWRLASIFCATETTSS